MTQFAVEISICGAYNWMLYSPIEDVTIRFEAEDGNEWKEQLCLSDPDIEFNDSRISQLLLEHMYPVTTGYKLWIETPNGEHILPSQCEEPGFPFAVCNSQRFHESYGREIVWLGERSSLVHVIHLGWSDGKPIIFEVKASIWPPALFCVGKNQIHCFPIPDLSEAYLRRLWENVERCRDDLGLYPEAHSFLTACSRPSGIPT